MDKRWLLFLFLASALLLPGASVHCADPTTSGTRMSATAEKTFRAGQHVAVEVLLFENGDLRAEMTFRDKRDIAGLCAVAHFALEDRQGRVLEVHSLPRACVADIRDYRTVVNTIHWDGEVESPEHLESVSSLEIRIFSLGGDPFGGEEATPAERKAMFE